MVLLDIPHRKFYVFGLTIWPQELYYLHIILLTFGVSLFLFTALLGRLWCGYACPQTIFTDAFNWIGKLAGGHKYGKPTADFSVWARVYPAWIALSLFFSFVFIGYFVPYEEMFSNLWQGNVFLHGDTFVPATWINIWAFFTLVSFVNMAYFRENLCKYACPYGRFQTALLDENSPIIVYSNTRGEPRRELKQKVGEHAGDCVGCNLCVAVCPTGIDIRDGLQIGCLSCGLCADACDQIMGKYEKETLIKYQTQNQADGKLEKIPYFRPRTAIYGLILTVLVSTFIFLLSKRVPIYAVALKDRNIQHIVIPGIGIQNGYEISVGNMSKNPLDVKIEVTDPSKFNIIETRPIYHVNAEGLEKVRLIVRYPESGKRPAAVSIPIEFRISDIKNPENIRITKSNFPFPSQR